MEDKNINQIFGIYKVLELINNPENKGRWYKVKCTICGKEFIKSWETIKRCTKNCQHEEKIEHFCQYCGKKIEIRKKETIKEFNNRKYCCLSCANKAQKKKPATPEKKAKISKGVLKQQTKNWNFSPYIDNFKDIYFENKFITLWNKDCYEKDKKESVDYVICPYCNTRFKQIQPGHLQLHNKTMEDLFSEFGLDFKTTSDYTTKQHSESSKKAIDLAIENGTKNAWTIRKTTSYPEKYWMEVLNNNGIKYEREHVIYQKDLNPELRNCFFLDFLIDGYIDLEIDGKQHLEPERIEHDKKRNKLLEDNGYVVYRIPWISPRYKPLQVKKQIDDFLSWYEKEKLNKKLSNNLGNNT